MDWGTLTMEELETGILNVCPGRHQEIAKEKAAFVMGQIRTMREDPPHCRCYCGMEIYTPLVFKCLYCGEYYCQPCAEEHFGKTRAEWAKEEPELEQALQDAKL